MRLEECPTLRSRSLCCAVTMAYDVGRQLGLASVPSLCVLRGLPMGARRPTAATVFQHSTFISLVADEENPMWEGLAVRFAHKVTYWYRITCCSGALIPRFRSSTISKGARLASLQAVAFGLVPLQVSVGYRISLVGVIACVVQHLQRLRWLGAPWPMRYQPVDPFAADSQHLLLLASCLRTSTPTHPVVGLRCGPPKSVDVTRELPEATSTRVIE